jgi:hypothetical protein
MPVQAEVSSGGTAIRRVGGCYRPASPRLLNTCMGQDEEIFLAKSLALFVRSPMSYAQKGVDVIKVNE